MEDKPVLNKDVKAYSDSELSKLMHNSHVLKFIVSVVIYIAIVILLVMMITTPAEVIMDADGKLYIERAHSGITNAMNISSKKHSIDINFLYAIAMTESSMDSTAVSKDGKVGLMQIPATYAGKFDVSTVEGNVQAYIELYAADIKQSGYMGMLYKHKTKDYINKVAEYYNLFTSEYLYNLKSQQQ